MSISPLQKYWYLLGLLGWKDKNYEVLRPYGVTSFKNLNAQKAEELTSYLQAIWSEKCQRPRGAVIHYLCIMPNHDFKKDDKPNYEKINEWVKGKMGKELNRLNMQELAKCVSMVKMWYAKELKK